MIRETEAATANRHRYSRDSVIGLAPRTENHPPSAGKFRDAKEAWTSLTRSRRATKKKSPVTLIGDTLTELGVKQGKGGGAEGSNGPTDTVRP